MIDLMIVESSFMVICNENMNFDIILETADLKRMVHNILTENRLILEVDCFYGSLFDDLSTI